MPVRDDTTKDTYYNSRPATVKNIEQIGVNLRTLFF